MYGEEDYVFNLIQKTTYSTNVDTRDTS